MQVIIKTLNADQYTPLLVFHTLGGIALLESALLEQGKSRYSILLLQEDYRLSLINNKTILIKNGAETVLGNEQDYLKILESHVNERTHKEGFPVPIPAALGYLSYEASRLCDDIQFASQQDVLHIPEATYIFGKTMAIFDHYKDTIFFVFINHDHADAAYATILKKLETPLPLPTIAVKPHITGDITAGQKEYEKSVEAVKQHIIAGNLLQAVLARTTKFTVDGLHPLTAYSQLRRANPSPYLFYLDCGTHCMFGSSPEVMVKVQDSIATIKPLAGTRPRGKTEAEDKALEKELLNDVKEQAEHIMLIDLARNDLGRIAIAGTVKPIRTFFIERYSHVMHIVSEVIATLAPHKTVFDVIRASFPAGTLSGAPKIKAIEILSALEPTKRGPYGGLVGYFDTQGNLDTCITIRSVIYKDNAYYVSAGAGIVYDSIPANEFQETVNKAAATVRSLGVNI